MHHDLWPRHFFQPLSLVGPSAFVTLCPDSKVCGGVTSCLSVRHPPDIGQGENWKRELATEMMFSKEMKSDNAGGGIWIECKWSYGRYRESWGCGSCCHLVSSAQPGNWEERWTSLVSVRNVAVTRRVGVLPRKPFTLEALLKIFHDVEGAKDNVLEDDLNSDRSPRHRTDIHPVSS